MASRTPQHTAIDIFSGCGGLTVGLQQAGFAVVGAVELNKLAVDTYRLNHDDVKVWHTDIRQLSGREIKRTLGIRKRELGLLAGCPPCQGFSRMRTLNGTVKVEDQRNDLVMDFLRLVEDLMPKAIMMENVPGLAEDPRMDMFVSGLQALGYTCKYDILDAADYAVPQRRKRLILLASRFGPVKFAPRARVRVTVRDAIGDLKPVGQSGDPAHDIPERRSQRVLDMIRQIPKNGGSRAALPAEHQLGCHIRCEGFRDVYGRMAWDDVSPTITGGCVNPSKGRFLHPDENRSVTIREAALLQSFPKTYKFPMERGKFPVAEMIGNALPPEFIRRHALSIVRHLS